MKTCLFSPIIVAYVLLSFNVSAAMLHVDVNNTSPASPYTNWTTAATNIQDAVDAANPGDTVLVTNGVYQNGFCVVYGALTNRVAVTKAVTVQSVNGPAVTTIQGGGSPYSDSAVRCVYLTNGASLSGFTISSGSTRAVSWPTATPENCGGGLWCESVSAVISNCVLVGNTAYFDGGGVYGGTLDHCTLTNNNSSGGGGAAAGTLTNCTLIGNSASVGGGAYQCLLDNCTIQQNSSVSGGGGALECALTHCTLLNNTTGGYGGGTDSSTLTNCTITGNTAGVLGGGASWGSLANCTLVNNTVNATVSGSCSIEGGGAYSATLINCLISGNKVINNSQASRKIYGGGASGGVLNNCVLSGNSCWDGGSGAYNATLNNCTVVGNSDRPLFGGGVYNCSVNNSIVRWNGVNYAGSSLYYCCTTPLPGGSGNIAVDPLLVNRTGGDFHLQSGSPCINSGNNTCITNFLDLDGNPRVRGGTVDIGAYEFQNPASAISYAWLQQYSLPINKNTDFSDADNDGLNNWQEWIAGTNPTNALSVLKMTSAAPTNNPTGLAVSWQSVSGMNYFIQRSSDLGTQPPFSTIQSNIVGQTGTTSYTDTTATNGGQFFYRVGVEN